MKILRLSFKNLNSLAGVWEVDFKHPDYVSSGIFAITGPTGAGKTTILDAICLALYGQTPRLGRITQGENEIMSRQTGECFAEVEFETAKGHFRCHWSQHRSRKSADGQLQPPRHEIAVAESGTILESKLRAVAEKVEDVTGMDFDRFTRSMLLAQGGFAAFLQARPDERAPILEQITGTAIYSRISVKVHERTSEERKLLAEMRAELEGIQLLSPLEAEALNLEKTELCLVEKKLDADAKLVREAQAWLERIAVLEIELLQLDQARHDFEGRKEAATPELERLALAGWALKLGGDHAHLNSIRAQQAGEQGELKIATDQLPSLQIAWQSAFEALELAESGLAQSRVEREQQAELIRLTRELDVKIGEAAFQLQGLTVEIEKNGRQNSGYRLSISQCDQRLNEIETELLGVVAFLTEHQVDAKLAEALAGIEQQLKSLKTLDEKYRETQIKLVRHAALMETARLSCSQTENTWQLALKSVTESEDRVAVICAAHSTLLHGRDLSVWRDEVETLASRYNRLEIIKETLARIEEIKPKLAGLKLRATELEQKRHLLVQQDNVLSGEYELRERVASQLQDNVILLNRVRSLEDDRRHLVDGVPCPLCGAGEHPYAAGNIPQLDEAQKELELALAATKNVLSELSRTKLELVAVGKDLDQAGLDQKSFQERQLSDEAYCTNAFLELGINSDSVSWSELIRNEAETCRLELATRRAIILSVEQNEQEERQVNMALAKLKDELSVHDKARLSSRLGQENALSEGTRLELEATALSGERERVQSEVKNVVAVYGCIDINPDNADELLAQLISRRTAYFQQVQARERLEKVRADVAAEVDKTRALLAESEKMLHDKEQLLLDKSLQRDALVEQRLEQYGERNPDIEEKRLTDALRLAGDFREAALQEQHRLQSELSSLKGHVERITFSIDQRNLQLFELEASFCLRLAEFCFADETVFLQACLPQKSFDELTQMADNLRNEETALNTRHKDRTETLSDELNKTLTDKPLDLIKEENRVVSEQLSELQKGLGAIIQRLQQYADQQQRHQGSLQAIVIQKVECDRWERLHSLIGSGDGKKFRNFAQGLTFELMVAHANRQLQKMSDRYILTRDGTEPLELNVIDNYQAGEIRSTKNLSGGESFIASLALSLGLSSMASRNVRVDSLFLDEGFGTLDEDALEMALETLSGLQQDGKLIGIISHVPALKERIGTQIQVEAGSGGRSRLSGPGCRRVV